MKKVTFKPKKDFTGQVEISLPSARQRIRYVKECNFKFNSDGEVSVMDNIDAMEKMYEIAEKHVTKVNLKHEDGASFKDFNKMADDSLCDDVCQSIIGVVLQGSLGEG
jgi:hypothetical protein